MNSTTYRCSRRNHLGTLGICRCRAEAYEEVGSVVALKKPNGACRSRLPSFGVVKHPQCVWFQRLYVGAKPALIRAEGDFEHDSDSNRQ